MVDGTPCAELILIGGVMFSDDQTIYLFGYDLNGST